MSMNPNTVRKNGLDAMKQPPTVQNEVYVTAAIGDMQCAANLVNMAAMHANDVGLSGKANSQVRKSRAADSVRAL